MICIYIILIVLKMEIELFRTSLLIILLGMVFTPFILLFCNHYVLKKKYSLFKLLFINCVLIYLLYNAQALIKEHYYDLELSKFDLNGDGMFTGAEITVEQEKAMYNVIADTGRTLAPITGIIIAFFYNGVCVIFFYIISIVISSSFFFD